jgi:hypothetical protein
MAVVAYESRRSSQEKGVAIEALLGVRTIFRYNGIPSDDRIINDLSGAGPPHILGDIVKLNDKSWKVVGVVYGLVRDGEVPISLHRVFLTDKF